MTGISHVTALRLFYGTALVLIVLGVSGPLKWRPWSSMVISAAWIWFFFLAVVFFLIFFFASSESAWFVPSLLIPAGLVLFSWYLTVKVFESDCRWTLQSLEEHIFSEVPLVSTDTTQSQRQGMR